MSGEVESTSTEGVVWSDVAAYLWVLALVALAGAEPTAAVIAGWLRLLDVPVLQLGSTLSIGGQAPQVIASHWTAVPAIVLGGGLIFAARAPLAKRVKGFTFLALNCWLVDLFVLGMAAQLPPTYEGVDPFEPPVDNPTLGVLGYAFPVLMTFVVATALWYFQRRILPEETGGNVGHAKERMDALETGGVDG